MLTEDKVIVTPSDDEPFESVQRMVPSAFIVLDQQLWHNFPRDGKPYKVTLTWAIEPYGE